MNIAIVKYNAGNVQSVIYALNRLGLEPLLSDDAETLRKADKVIFPGVGEASSAMRYLRSSGLDRVICSLEQPVLGICLGMQLLCKHSEEGDTDCLGIFDETVTRFRGPEKIPQIGWNTVSDLKGPLFTNITEHSYMYFVHGYYVPQNRFSIAEAHYMLRYSAALQKDNFYAVQFHPEKSTNTGEQLIKNFIEQC